MRHIIQSTLQSDLTEAYRQLTLDFESIGRNALGAPVFPADDAIVQEMIRSAAARCGAAVAAAVKREKRMLLLNGLLQAKKERLDITPTVAQRAAQRFLGRGLDGRTLAKLFSTPGRTAANKSATSSNDLAAMERQLDNRIGPLLVEIEERKQDANAKWRGSAERFNALADWRAQRLAQFLPVYELS